METKNKIQEEINLTMQSIDGIKRADVNPYLFNKVMSRINENDETSVASNRGFRLAFVMLTLFIVVNIFTIFMIQKSSNQNTYTREQNINNITYEYFLTNPTNSY